MNNIFLNILVSRLVFKTNSKPIILVIITNLLEFFTYAFTASVIRFFMIQT
ncbi:hypothetical protein VDIAB_100502 [Vibrio diabolicus]|nr:hypothetical protein VDIAB_100502 [Vibrio diabolicus]